MIRKVLMVGHYVEPPWCDGVVNTIKSWSEGLTKSGLKVSVLSTTSDPTRKSLALNGVQYHYFLGSRKRFQYPLNYILRFCSNSMHYLKTENADICHFHGLRSIPALFPFKLFSRARFCFSFHNTPRGFVTYPTIGRFMEKTFDLITVPDNRAYSFLKASGISENKISVIPPGIDTRFFSPKNRKLCRSLLGIPMNTFVIMYAGHFKRGRGVEQLITSFHKLKHSNPSSQDLYLILAWTGYAEKGYYERLIRKIKGESGVIIVGPQEDMSLLYNSADVVVSPILGDESVISIPLNIIEAMSCGKIIISTNVGAVRQFLSDEVNGFLINIGDDDAIFKKLSAILEESFDRVQMENLAREAVVKNFSIDIVTRKLASFYGAV